MDRLRYRLIIPAAGIGKRFFDAGYSEPKPYIEVIDGLRMLDLVIRNMRSQLGFDVPVSVIIRKDLGPLPFPVSSVDVICIDDITSGAAETVRLGLMSASDDESIIICNCDQFVTFDGPDFLKTLSEAEGAVLIFEELSRDPKWSYAEIEGDIIVRVAEKIAISTHATVGIYGFDSRSRALNAINSMMYANDKYNNEFYLCPAFNYIEGKAKVRTTKRMWGIGTPDDLHAALRDHDFMTEIEKLK